MSKATELKDKFSKELSEIQSAKDALIEEQVAEFKQKIIDSTPKTDHETELEEIIAALAEVNEEKIEQAKPQIIMQQPAQPQYNYKEWEADLGFLTLIINRKINIASSFDIEIFGSQLQNKNDFIKDKDVEDIINPVVSDIFDTLSGNYIDYLTDKYFGSNKSLITFITESVYDALIRKSIDTNMTKVKRQYSDDMTEMVNNLNEKNREKL